MRRTTSVNPRPVTLVMIWLFVLVVGVVAITAALTGLPAFALPPPPPPDPPGGDPPPPPTDDESGAEPGNENVILPTAETIVYDASEASGELTCIEIDPETNLPVNVRVANDQILITFDPQSTIEEIDSALAAVGAWKKADIQAIGEWVAGFEPVTTCEALQAKIDQLKTNPLVLSAAKCMFGDYQVWVPDDPKYPAGFGEDPSFYGQWNLRRAGIDVAWTREQGKGTYSTIGIVDTGVQLNHPDLAAKLRADCEAATGMDHGTACTGIAAGATNNGVGIAGVGWNVKAVTKNAGNLAQDKIVQKVLDVARSSSTTPGGIVDISMSFATPPGTSQYEGAINEAFKQGILPVAATGNEGVESYKRPACFTRTMAVGASWRWLNGFQGALGYEARWFYSNYGNHVSVLAPGGTNIRTLSLNNMYNDLFGGTSASAPLIAGLAALVRSEYQSMGPLDIRHRIEDTAFDQIVGNGYDPYCQPIPGWDKWTGWGLAKGDQATASQPVSTTISGNKWHMVVMPVWPKENPALTQWQASTFPQNVLPPAPSGSTRFIKHIKPGTDQYYTQSQYDANGYPLIGLIKPFRAFWVKYTNVASIALVANGSRAGLKPGHNLEFPLYKGHNLIGNPFVFSNLPFRNQNISFRLGNNSTTKTLSEAMTAGWVGKCHYWNPDTAQYVRVYPNQGHNMPPFRGYILYTYVDNLYMLVKRS